jgi:hypothetical protein
MTARDCGHFLFKTVSILYVLVIMPCEIIKENNDLLLMKCFIVSSKNVDSIMVV